MSRRTLRKALQAALLVGVLLMAGCTQLLSVNEDGLILGVGLDTGHSPGQVRVTLQWIHHGAPGGASAAGGGGGGGSAAGGGGGGGGGGGSKILTISGAAPGVAGAVAKVAGRTDQRITFVVTDFVVLGEGLARRGATGPLNYFWRKGEFPESAQVAVAHGEAAKLLESHFPGGTAEELGRRLVRSSLTDTGSVPITIWRFLARMASSGEAAWAPILAQEPGGFRADGTALFQKDRLTGELSQEQTAPLSWLLKSGGYGDLMLPALSGPGGEPAVLHVVSRSLRRRVVDETRARLDLRLRAEVVQGPGLLLEDRSAASLEAAAARQAREDVRGVLDRLQAAGSDVLGLGEVLRERDPAAVAHWPRAFRRMHIGVRVRVQVLPSGRGA